MIRFEAMCILKLYIFEASEEFASCQSQLITDGCKINMKSQAAGKLGGSSQMSSSRLQSMCLRNPMIRKISLMCIITYVACCMYTMRLHANLYAQVRFNNCVIDSLRLICGYCGYVIDSFSVLACRELCGSLCHAACITHLACNMEQKCS